MDIGFPLTRQNYLTVNVFPIVSGKRLQLNALFLDDRGNLVPNTVTIPTTTAGTKTETEMQCLDGYLLSVTVTDDAATAKNGEVYCTVSIKVGQVDTNSPLAVLVRGYVYENSPIYYPGGKDRSEMSGFGRFRHYAGAAPGAGNAYSETLEAYKSYNIIGVAFTYTASAVVATRYLYLQLATDTGIVHYVKSSPNPAASQAIGVRFTTLGNDIVGASGINGSMGLQRNTPFQGAVKALEIGAINMDAGDAITGIVITLEEFAELPGF